MIHHRMGQELDSERLLAVIGTQEELVASGLDLDAVLDLVAERAQALTEAAAAVLEIEHGDEDFSQADVELLGLLSGVVAAHMTHTRSAEAGQDDDRRDALTGLPNRSYFDEHLGKEVARARRLGAPLTLCLFDLDGFKQVNDRLGFSAGDAVLQAAARTFTDLRAGDIACRIGGDEFALVLPGAGEADAERVAHRIARTVSGNDDCLGVTASWGVATLEESDPHQFLARADAALYAAKRALAVSR